MRPFPHCSRAVELHFKRRKVIERVRPAIPIPSVHLTLMEADLDLPTSPPDQPPARPMSPSDGGDGVGQIIRQYNTIWLSAKEYFDGKVDDLVHLPAESKDKLLAQAASGLIAQYELDPSKEPSRDHIRDTALMLADKIDDLYQDRGPDEQKEYANRLAQGLREFHNQVDPGSEEPDDEPTDDAPEKPAKPKVSKEPKHDFDRDMARELPNRHQGVTRRRPQESIDESLKSNCAANGVDVGFLNQLTSAVYPRAGRLNSRVFNKLFNAYAERIAGCFAPEDSEDTLKHQCFDYLPFYRKEIRDNDIALGVALAIGDDKEDQDEVLSMLRGRSPCKTLINRLRKILIVGLVSTPSGTSPKTLMVARVGDYEGIIRQLDAHSVKDGEEAGQWRWIVISENDFDFEQRGVVDTMDQAKEAAEATIRQHNAKSGNSADLPESMVDRLLETDPTLSMNFVHCPECGLKCRRSNGKCLCNHCGHRFNHVIDDDLPESTHSRNALAPVKDALIAYIKQHPYSAFTPESLAHATDQDIIMVLSALRSLKREGALRVQKRTRRNLYELPL
jgi:uncharacterized Zn finger protein (UPF0148 family)